jgi:hypothetical protein
MIDRYPIETAPHDGQIIRVYWLNELGLVEYGPETTRWLGDKWAGDWTPTHWLPEPEPPKWPDPPTGWKCPPCITNE